MTKSERGVRVYRIGDEVSSNLSDFDSIGCASKDEPEILTAFSDPDLQLEREELLREFHDWLFEPGKTHIHRSGTVIINFLAQREKRGEK